MPEKIVLASSNAGKLSELQALFTQHSLGMEIVPQSSFSLTEAEETGLSFVENAILKARHASHLTGLPALADDSGLEVDYLQGAPGIYSSRFAGPEASDHLNIEKLLELLKGVSPEKRTARFQCLLVFMRHAEDPTPLICQGIWEGLILETQRGSQGFGYDPVFYVPERKCSAAELPKTEKNQLSHRARAMTRLLDHLRQKPHFYSQC